MTRARSARDLDSVLQVAREVADAHPGSLEAQRFAGEVAYRASRWPEAAAYLQRGSEPDEPQLLFYLAVALHETGQAQEAARVLRKALPGIQRTPFVDSYIGRILGTAAP
jgi:predicted Zn-dependent protease